MQRIVLLDKNNPLTSPFIKGGQRGIIKGGLGGIKGLTLVEVLIAMVILLLVSLALMQTALVSIDANMRNVLRDEAVSVAEMRMDEARNIPFDTLATDTSDGNVQTFPACAGATAPAAGPYPVLIQRNIRNITGFNFGTQRTVIALSGDDSQVTVLVRWEYRNECFTHTISTIMKRQ